MAVIVSLAPADLLIDEENPRISEPNSGQRKALESLAGLLGKKLRSLAADIVKYGLDPSNLPVVMPVVGSPSRYWVLEGNRRLAALRALENPESVSDAVKPVVLQQLRKLSREYAKNPIDSVTCLLINNRDEARHWILLRHTGLNNGAGILPWGSDDAARFKHRTGLPEVHSQAMNFLQSRGDLSVELRRKVPATNLKRLLETPAVRAKLGLDVERGELQLVADANHVAKALMYVVNDLVTKKTRVGQIYTKAQREEYAQRLPADIVVTSRTRTGTPAAGGTTSAAKPTGGRTSRSGKKRDRLIPRDCTLSISEPRVQDIETELRKLSLEDHTNAISVLFRVFLELSVDAYLEDHGLGVSEEAALHKKMAAVANDLVAKRKLTPKQRTPVSRACQKDSFLAPSIELMHQYVHNKNVFPAPGDLRANWDSLQPFIAAVWTP